MIAVFSLFGGRGSGFIFPENLTSLFLRSKWVRAGEAPGNTGLPIIGAPGIASTISRCMLRRCGLLHRFCLYGYCDFPWRSLSEQNRSGWCDALSWPSSKDGRESRNSPARFLVLAKSSEGSAPFSPVGTDLQQVPWRFHGPADPVWAHSLLCPVHGRHSGINHPRIVLFALLLWLDLLYPFHSLF